MKNKILVLLMTLAVTVALGTTVEAKEISGGKVALDSSFAMSSDLQLEEAFKGMAPGDSRTIAIEMNNESGNTASFYISQKTIAELENANAQGGAYSYKLEMGTEDNKADVLSTNAGGYTKKEQKKSATGLSDITELEGYTYLTDLVNGTGTNLYLTLSINGEGFDSTEAVNYSNTVGELQLGFRAVYVDRQGNVFYQTVTSTGATKNTVVTLPDQAVPLAGNPKTGDSALLYVIIALLVVGNIMVAIGVSKKRKAQ